MAAMIVGPLAFLAALWLLLLPIQLGEWVIERLHRRKIV